MLKLSIMLKLYTTLVLLLACGFALAAPPASDQSILLINNPKVWARPSPDSSSQPTAWTAGKRLQVLEKKMLPGAAGLAENAWHRVQEGKIAGWLPDAYLAPPPQQIDSAALAGIGAEPVDRFHGLPPEYAPQDLVAVGPLYDKEVKARLREEAAQALELMIAAARRDGVRLQVVSGYRPWSKQQELYEKRVRANGTAQNTVAKPGHSEHQLGTAVDLTDGDEDHLLRESFGDTPAGRWLREHAWTYGFAISFTRHNNAATGVAPEPWHYRYWGIAQARSRHLAALGE